MVSGAKVDLLARVEGHRVTANLNLAKSDGVTAFFMTGTSDIAVDC